MDNGVVPEGAAGTAKRGRPAAKNAQQRITALAEKIAELRTQENARKRKETAQLAQLIGNTIMAIINDNDDPELCSAVIGQLRERITRSTQREFLERWLASQHE